MGYYLPNNVPFSTFNATEIKQPESISELTDDKALICVVNNGPFKANALIYSDNELKAFSPSVHDTRPKNWYTMNKKSAHFFADYTF